MASKVEFDIQQLYVTYFGRPADRDGLKYWTTLIEANKGSTADVAAAFSQSMEYKQITGSSDAAHIVNNLYLSLFSRNADFAGLNFWANGLSAGSFTIAQAGAAIAAGALGSDLRTFQAKAAAAIDFTNALDTSTKVTYYQSLAGIMWGKAFLAQVTEDNPHPPFDIPIVRPLEGAIGLVGIPTPNLHLGSDGL